MPKSKRKFGRIEALLLEILKPEEFVKVAETLGGGRHYIPKAGHDGPLAQAVGAEIAAKLAAAFHHDYIQFPLGRESRAKYYQAQGMSEREIARRLGMGLRGVQQLFDRLILEADDAKAKR